MNNSNNSIDKKAAHKEAFVKGLIAGGKNLATKFNGSYVMDAVRKNRLQNMRAIVDEPMSMHGMALKALEENGAVGAGAVRKGINKGRVLLGDIDTGLGAMAVGKKGLTDPDHKSLRKTLFTFKKDNYRRINQPGGGHVLVNQERPSITAPLHTVSNIVVPSLAMMKGQEIVESFKNKGETQTQGG